MKRLPDRNEICNLFFGVGQILLFLLAIDVLYSNLLFLVGRIITWRSIPVSFTIALLVYYNLYPNKTSKQLIIETVSSITILCVFSWIVGKIYDYSWDGNSYHKLAVGLLQSGWNPVREIPRLEVFGADPSVFNLKWVESYCKATWIFGAGIYALTGNIESGKVYSAIGIVCAFSVSFYFFHKIKISIYKSFIIALCIAFNPIAIQQMFTFYLDGFLQVMLEVLVISLIMLYNNEVFEPRISRALVLFSMIICGNSKFTGLFYGGTFCAAFYIASCMKAKDKGSSWLVQCIREFAFYLLVALSTVAFGGASTYVTNIVRHQSPIYPLSITNHNNIISANTPFPDENHLKNLFLSIFSKTDNFTIASNRGVELKIPFTIDWSYESEYIVLPDARLGGFGVLFSGVFVIALFCLLFYFIFAPKDTNYLLYCLVVGVSVILVLTIKESWWARYAPQLYFIAIAALTVLLYSRFKIIRIVGVVMAVVIFINNIIPLTFISDYYNHSKETTQELLNMKTDRVIEVYSGGFEGTYFNLRDKNVFYIINNDLVSMDDLNHLEYMDMAWKYR